MFLRAGEKLLQAAGWIAAAYLGYWLVILFEQALAGTLAAWSAGVMPDWRMDAFSLRPVPFGRGSGGGFDGLRRVQWMFGIVGSLVLTLLARFSAVRSVPSSLGIMARRIFLLASFWVAVHRLPELARLAQRGGGLLRGWWGLSSETAILGLLFLLGALFLVGDKTHR